MEAIRSGGVAVANMPGSGRAGDRAALLGFLPALCRRLLGEDLKLPNIATWWCGQPRERASVLDAARRAGDPRRLRRPAARTSPAPRMVLGAELDAAERERAARARSRRAAIDYVGQEVVRLSTTPVWAERPPRAAPVRAARLRGRDARRLAGHARRLLPHRRRSADARAVSMGEGVQSADVWVLADKPVAPATPAAGERRRADPPHRRHSAEPRRRQPVLARPLSGARRGDPAPRALPVRPAATRPASAPQATAHDPSGCEQPARRLGRGLGRQAPARSADSAARRCTTRAPTARRSRLRARGPARGLEPARAPVARHLAADRRARRPVRARRDARRARPATCWSARNAALADPGGALRPRAGEHEPRRRLALPRHGPAHRARHQHLPLRAAVRRRRAPAPTISTCCSTSSTRRSPIARATSSGSRWRRCATWWCSTPTIRARSPSRSRPSNDHLAALPLAAARTACWRRRAASPLALAHRARDARRRADRTPACCSLSSSA